VAWLRRILGVGLLLLVLYAGWRLAAANSTPVTVSYVFGEFEGVEHWRTLLVAFVVGAGVMSLLLVYEVIKAWLMRRRYRHRVAELESEVHQLRNLPLSADESTAVCATGGAPAQGA
jgi:uncharacterized integral membrane protein